MIYVSILLTSLALAGKSGSGTVPKWLDKVIQSAFPEGTKTKVNPESARVVQRFEYQGKTVYFIPGRCCDIPSIVYDNEGQYLCSPSGGLTGHGDGKCSDFHKRASGGQQVWP